METITLKEFEEKYMKPSKNWDYSKFDIVCKKCSSKKIEFNGQLEVGTGYYDEIEKDGEVVVKCHDCGNAFKMDFWSLEV
jgi:hypothetical protein